MQKSREFIQFMLRGLRRKDAARAGLILKIARWTLALSFAILIIASAVIRGFNHEISKKIFDFWGHIHVTSTAFTQSLESQAIRSSSSWVDSIYKIKHFQETYYGQNGITKHGRRWLNVENVVPFAIMASILETENDMDGIFVKAIGASHPFYQDKSTYIRQGHIPKVGSRDILISEHIADRLRIGMGDKVRLTWVRDGRERSSMMNVCGIYNTGLLEYDRIFSFTSFDILRDLQSWSEDQISGYEIFIDDPRLADAFNNYIYNEWLPMDWFSTSVSSRFRSIFQWLKLQSQNETVLVTILGIVVIINLMTILLIFIIGQMHTIGVLKALGATNYSVRMLFLSMGFRFVVKSLILGNAMGIGLCLVQKHLQFIKLSEADYYLSHAPILLDPQTLLVFNLVILLVTTCCMWFPTYFIGKFSPLRIIKYD